MNTTPLCKDCGEEPGTSPDGRCRDCDIEYVGARGSCRECGVFIMREDFGGPRASQHRPTCTLKDNPEYWARDERELSDLRKGVLVQPETCLCGYDSTETPGCGSDQCDLIRKDT